MTSYSVLSADQAKNTCVVTHTNYNKKWKMKHDEETITKIQGIKKDGRMCTVCKPPFHLCANHNLPDEIEAAKPMLIEAYHNFTASVNLQRTHIGNDDLDESKSSPDDPINVGNEDHYSNHHTLKRLRDDIEGLMEDVEDAESCKKVKHARTVEEIIHKFRKQGLWMQHTLEELFQKNWQVVDLQDEVKKLQGMVLLLKKEVENLKMSATDDAYHKMGDVMNSTCDAAKAFAAKVRTEAREELLDEIFDGISTDGGESLPGKAVEAAKAIDDIDDEFCQRFGRFSFEEYLAAKQKCFDA